MVLEEGRPVPVAFGAGFVTTDQDVADLASPRPETRWCLLEMPKEQLEELQAGQPFALKELSAGGAAKSESSGAVLCTSAATFGLEFLENSNSLFLAAVRPPGAGAPDPEQGLGCTVFGQCRGQLILKPGTGDAQRVQELLAAQPLGAPAAEGEEARRITTQRLEYEVAASPAELRAALEAGPYVEHEGAWRLLPAALEREILDAATSVVTALGWRAEAVDPSELFREVQQHFGDQAQACVPSPAVLRKALRSVLADAPAEPAPTGPGGEPLLALDGARVQRFRALQLLREPPAQLRQRLQLPAPPPRKRARLGAAGQGRDGPPLRREELAAAFREATGSEATVEEVLALVADGSYVDELEGTVHALDARALPQDPMERLKRLFELQSHWQPERLAALIAPALGKGMKPDPWLMKFARSVHVEVEQGKEQRMLVKKFAGL